MDFFFISPISASLFSTHCAVKTLFYGLFRLFLSFPKHPTGQFSTSVENPVEKQDSKNSVCILFTIKLKYRHIVHIS
ncbi:hypothetical protein HMPREF0262_00384 [Clostridium sp. ATCC 29733]|nr:hypothetical protein HMPREF0262_00384 [Clostridium sp. ATCC 29733]